MQTSVETIPASAMTRARSRNQVNPNPGANFASDAEASANIADSPGSLPPSDHGRAGAANTQVLVRLSFKAWPYRCVPHSHCCAKPARNEIFDFPTTS